MSTSSSEDPHEHASLFPVDRHVPEPQLDSPDITDEQLRLFLLQAGTTHVELHHVVTMEQLRALAKERLRQWHAQRVLACRDAKTPQHLLPPAADKKAEKDLKVMLHPDHIIDPSWKAEANEAFQYVQEVLRMQQPRESTEHVLTKMSDCIMTIRTCRIAAEYSSGEAASSAATVAANAATASAAVEAAVAATADPRIKARDAARTAMNAAREAADATAAATAAASSACKMGEAANRLASCADDSFDEGAKLMSAVFGDRQAEGLLEQMTVETNMLADAVRATDRHVSAAKHYETQAAADASHAAVMAEVAAAAVFPDGFVGSRPESEEVFVCQAGAWVAGSWVAGSWVVAHSVQTGSWPACQQELQSRWEARRVLACEETGRPDWLVPPGSTLMELHAHLLSNNIRDPRHAEPMQRALQYVNNQPANCVRSVLLKHGVAAAQQWVFDRQRDMDLLAGQPPCSVSPGCMGTMRALHNHQGTATMYVSCTECKVCMCTVCRVQLSHHGFSICCMKPEDGDENVHRNVRPRVWL